MSCPIFWSKVSNADRSRSRVFGIFACNRVEQEGIFLTVGAKGPFGLMSYQRQWDRNVKPFRRLVWTNESRWRQQVGGWNHQYQNQVTSGLAQKLQLSRTTWWTTRNLGLVPSIFSGTVVEVSPDHPWQIRPCWFSQHNHALTLALVTAVAHQKNRLSL